MYAVFLDIEATGLDPKIHSAIDIAFCIVDITENRILAKYQSLLAISKEEWNKSDPRSLLINGYTWELIQHGKSLEAVREEIIQLLAQHDFTRGKAVFICQNPAFDRAFFTHIVDIYTQENLVWPYHWLDLASMYWAFLVKDFQARGIPFPTTLSLSKNDIAAHYHLPAEREPHRAMQGVEHLMQCYEMVLNVSFQEQTIREIIS